MRQIHSHITESLVIEAFAKDVGDMAIFKSFNVVDFTKKGDSVVQFVTSVTINYDDDGILKEICYKAKSGIDVVCDDLRQILTLLHRREKTILSQVIPAMNLKLEKLELAPLKVEKLLASSVKNSKDVLILTNLSTEGFVAFERSTKLDVSHALIAMEEIARFHASSILIEAEEGLPKELNVMWDDPNSMKLLEETISSQINRCITQLEGIQNFKETKLAILEMNVNLGKKYIDALKVKDEKFKIIAHGDFSIKNMLFRYNKFGSPVALQLTNFQFSREMSVACDLLQFFYTSLNENSRLNDKSLLLVQYYQAFSKVLLMADYKVPFTFQELEKEIQDRLFLGLLACLVECPNLRDYVTSDEIDFKRENKDLKKMDPDEYNCIERSFLSMLDGMVKANVIKI